MAGHLYALLVGIEAYPAPVPPLAGCVNDVRAMAEVLRGRVEPADLSTLVLTDGQATRDAVLSALPGHLGAAGPDDTALFYFSGHGSRQAAPPEQWAGEPDHRSETIVCVDSRQPGSWDIADTELAAHVAQVAASGCHVLVVLDCCHSGSGTRDVDERVRLAPDDPRVRPATSFSETAMGQATGTTRSARPPEGRGAWAPAAGRHVLLAACRSDEKAKEVTALGRDRGALSVALEAALREGDGHLTYREVLRAVSAGVQRRTVDQHPQLEATDASELDRPFLGGTLPTAPRSLTLSHLPDGWSIDYGALHGVPEPIGDDSTELAVYPLAGETTEAPLATATVTRVLPDRSIVDLSGPLDDGFVYRAVITTIPLRPLTVAVRGSDADTERLRAAAAAADSALITLVADNPDADLVVEAVDVEPADGGFVITRPGVTRPLVPVFSGEGRDERTVSALEHVARWIRLSALRNPATHLPRGAVTITVTAGGGEGADGGGRAGAGESIPICYDGDTPPRFTVTLANTTSTALWAALLDLTETYGIFTDAFASGSVALGPGESTSVALTGQVSDDLWRAGTVSVTDQLTLVTSTLEFDPRSLEQDELDVATAPSAGGTRGAGRDMTRGTGVAAGPRSTLERIFTRVTTRRLGPATPSEALADWRTESVFVTTTRPLT